MPSLLSPKNWWVGNPLGPGRKPRAQASAYRERPLLPLPSLFRKVAPRTVAEWNPQDQGSRATADEVILGTPAPRSAALGEGKMLLRGGERPRLGPGGSLLKLHLLAATAKPADRETQVGGPGRRPRAF